MNDKDCQKKKTRKKNIYALVEAFCKAMHWFFREMLRKKNYPLKINMLGRDLRHWLLAYRLSGLSGKKIILENRLSSYKKI